MILTSYQYLKNRQEEVHSWFPLECGKFVGKFWPYIQQICYQWK